MKLGPGTTIASRFELRSIAGKGGMGSVFRAIDRESGREVAVKVLGLEGPLDLARFAREASLLATIHHRNVVDYVAHGDVDGVHYIAQEWVDGVTFATQLRTIGVTPREAVSVVLGVADALGAAHERGIVHRDIKPSNIILAGGDSAQVKLVDFGIARKANEAGMLTRTGVLVGTPNYMSPEQARGEVFIDPSSDVWALGCVLYEALTGRLPFAGATPSAIRAKVMLLEPPPLHASCAEASDELAALVVEMLAKRAVDRPANGAALAARLRACAPLPDEPRRRFVRRESTTNAMPVRPKRTPKSLVVEAEPAASFVLVAPLAPEQDSESRGKQLESVAVKHDLDLHVFDDGSALLAARRDGKSGAVEAAEAARDLHAESFDGAVCVFGKAYGDTLSDVLDRGGELLEQATMQSLFDEPAIRVDDVIAELLADEEAIAQSERGLVLRVPAKS